MTQQPTTPAPALQPRHLKTIVGWAFIVSGLLLFVWPFFVFEALMTDPLRWSTPRDLVRTMSWIAVVGYPVIWGVSLFLAVRGLKKAQSPRSIALATAAPYLLIGLLVLSGR